MTDQPYTQSSDDGIDADHLLARPLSDADQALFVRYNTAFQLACYWPCVDHFRACVAAFDEMTKGPADGAHQDH